MVEFIQLVNDISTPVKLGWVGVLLWGIVHVCFLIGFRNRTAVLLDWLWAYVTFQRGSRLITGSIETM